MSIGIGGAGSKLAALLDNGEGTIVNVSETELNKVEARHKLRATIHSSKGQLRGSRKDPHIAREAFLSIRDVLLEDIRGSIVFSSTGGGTGNGICSVLLETLSKSEQIPLVDKTMFGFMLPYPEREAAEFVDNTIDFLQSPVSLAIDAGNTGNILLFSNKHKFVNRIPEGQYNEMVIDSLQEFLDIPQKGEALEQLDGNIDYEDFNLFLARPYFNHFCHFDYDTERSFEEQLKANYNPYLLPPAGTIEALFVLQLPDPKQTSIFYDILDYFSDQDSVAPSYSVLHNPELEAPRITVSLLYSRKPLELVDDFNSISETHKRTRVQKSVEQYVTLSRLEVNLTDETREAAETQGAESDEILSVLKRIGKL